MYFDGRLRELAWQVEQKAHLESTLESLYRQRTEIEKKVSELAYERSAEQEDVDELENTTLKSLFFRLIGQIDDKLLKERAEAAAAEEKHAMAQRELADVDVRIREKQSALSALRECGTEYQRLLKEKEEAIQREDRPEAAKILACRRQIAALDARRRELEEAAEEGRRTIPIIERMLAELDEAHKLAKADVFFDSWLMDLSKHDALDRVQEQVGPLQLQLRRFSTELADVDEIQEIRFQIDEMPRFADIFFDGLFSCFEVMDRIERTQEAVEAVARQVEALLEKVAASIRLAGAEQSRLQEEIRDIVMKAPT